MVIFASALLPVALVGMAFFLLDRNKEPVWAVLRAFLYGVLSAPLLAVFIIPLSLVPFPEQSSVSQTAVRAFLFAGLPEELVKYGVFLLSMYRRAEFDEWYDGILYGVMIGLGFAFVENLGYFWRFFPTDGGAILIGRTLLSMPMHALLGAVMGYFLGRAKFTLNKAAVPRLMTLALLVPVLFHGTYDFVLMFTPVDLGWLSAPIVFVLWFYVLRMKRTAQAPQTV